MKINIKDVEHVALLSRLTLTEDEKEEQVEQLNKILGAMDILNTVDTSNIKPLSHILPTKNVLRDDKVGETLSEERTFQNAPEVEERMFKVPKIV
ncbi:aspartyl/glutamyl-tRNA(Asn/Gln) amidotransferase subunit C [Desulfonispora thiosulfatigenes DSM 11270]|uniref:Aspartyl/glutamyl-tRNA(Asn/Gln) amidotransferase subunit C n=1 Tax=Desulfonispora thiosulfatigenes DSM 11270 TaxID=656914 RepID=A0A1W1UH65_DESTI|nr:Asp-tRNA(Asn)/Glu-tRNA(Gln) amidotransferase subunit GatC [Desulfonispora thiosulfatigenes]SMB80151.1 aspartyl/glutamyl-tRNA(Asn/Gln) amidotransferase subunit C [Desulfonispora thiosulfatigenes DSM 11270]